MRSARLKLSAFAVIGAMLVAVAAPLAAEEPTRGVCAARQHDCGRTVQLKPCCCGPQHEDAGQAGTVVSAVQLAPDSTHVALAPAVRVLIADARFARAAIDRSPPGTRSLDLPTLFSTLLI